MSGSLDTSDILVVIDRGDTLSVNLQPPDQYGISIKSGDTYVVNVDLPTIIHATETDNYYRVADFANFAATASFIGGFGAAVDWQAVVNKPAGLVSSSTQVDYNEIQNQPSIIPTASFAFTASFATNATLPDGIVSSSSQINTGSFTGSFIGDGSQLSGIATELSFIGDDGSSSINLKDSVLEIFGGNGIGTIVSGNTVTLNAVNGIVSSSTQIDYTQIQNQPSSIPTASYVEYSAIVNTPTLVSSSVQINTGSFSGSFIGDGSQLTGLVTDLRISGSAGSDVISLLNDTLLINGTNGVTTTVTDNTVTISIPAGTVSSSVQINTGSFSGSITSASFAITASAVLGTVTSASYALNADTLDGLNSTVFATTGSNIFNGNQTITGSLITNADTLIFTGSIFTSGSMSVVGGSITASLFGTASSATTSSYAVTASFIDGGFY